MTEQPPITSQSQGSTGGYHLPPEAYFDSGWFEREQRTLFPATWSFVCTKGDVQEPGSFYTTRIGHCPIAVVRGDDGEIRAFHNICRHRGARILDDRGKCGRIICPYHRWQYGLDGRLQNVPQQKSQISGMRTDEWGLQPIALGIWMGLIFINIDGRAAPLESWLGELPSHLACYDLENLVQIAESEYVFEANWKFYVENHIDWYHLWYTHAETLSMLDHHRGRRLQTGPHWLSFDPYKPNEEESEPFDPLPGLTREQQAVGAHLVFPNLPLFGGGSWFATGHLTPLTPDRTRMSLRLWALPDQNPAAFLESFHRTTQVEDAGVAARLQDAVRSPAFRVGPLTRDYESAIGTFHESYLNLMR